MNPLFYYHLFHCSMQVILRITARNETSVLWNQMKESCAPKKRPSCDARFFMYISGTPGHLHSPGGLSVLLRDCDLLILPV